jgi:hypothetical protein
VVRGDESGWCIYRGSGSPDHKAGTSSPYIPQHVCLATSARVVTSGLKALEAVTALPCFSASASAQLLNIIEPSASQYHPTFYSYNFVYTNSVTNMPGLPGSFRFTALPAEIRNKIYRDLLCTFNCDREPDGRFDSVLARLMREKEMLNGVCEAALNGNASILLASRQVYREAYDVMVKTNQFVRVRGHNFNFSELLLRGQLPVVTMDRARSAQFQGYMLCMDITDAEEFANDSSAVRFDCK